MFEWLSAVHMVVCEVAIVLQSKSIKLFRDSATGPNLSLTTDPYVLIAFPGFWLYPMIFMLELLLTVSVASVDSPSM